MKYRSQLRLAAIRLGHFLVIVLVGASVRLPAEDHTTTILDGVTNDLASPFTLGDTGPFNFLLLTNGAALTDTTGTVGNSIDAQANSAIVTGANSVWRHGSNFVLGATGGLNQVSILNGARLEVGWQAFLGLDQFGGGNHLIVSGSNSFLDMPWFHLGRAGSGNQITLADGARAGRGISNDILNYIGEEETSAGNFLYVTGPGTSWHTDGFRVGHGGRANGVIVNDGARLTNGFLTVGRNSSSTHNYVAVHGTGSVFKVQGGGALIGFGGAANLLRVAGGARFDTPMTTIGQSNSATGNRAEIDGAGTFWSNAGSVVVGQDGAANALVLTSGAALQSGSAFVGNNSSDNLVMVSASARARSATLAVGVGAIASGNVLQLDGSGTTWTNSGAATIGFSGSRNSLLISNGAVLIQSPGSGASLILGSNVTSRGNLIAVSGPGSHLSYQTKCTFGASGSDNRLILADGGRLTTASASIGANCVAAGNVLLATDPGTLWTSGIADVGFCSTNNSIIISNGANALLSSVRSSVQGGLGNSIVVTGPQSLFRSSTELNIGNSGVSNTLFILDGARVESGRDYLGFAGSENTVLVHGAGTTWSNASLTFGSNRGGAPFTGSRNLLALADGAWLDSGTLTLGAGSGTGENAVHVSGAGAYLNVRSNLVIGLFGTNNQVSISAGAGSAAQSVFLGASAFLLPTAGFPSHANRLSLDGSNSVLTIRSNLWVGYIGTSNRLEIRDGAQVNSQSGVLGAGSGASRSSALISGAGAVWNNSGDLTVGATGSGHLLTISHGGVARSRSGVVGLSGLPTGSGSTCVKIESSSKVLVTDPGSLWANEGQLYLGRQAIDNSLIVSNGAVVSAGGLLIGESSGISPGSFCAPMANANLLTIAGGCLVVTNTAHNAVLEPRFGTLTLSSGLVVTDYLVTTNNNAPGRVDLNGGTLRIGHAQWQSTAPLDVGDGLHAAHFHIPNGSAYFAGSLTIRPHGRLSGSAAIQTTVTNSGIIEPGNRDNGYMSFNGPFVQTPGGVLSFSIGGPETTADYTSMFVIPAAVFDGNLRVALRGGFQPSTNDWYRIIGCPTRTGEFANAPDRGRLLTADRLGSFLVLYTNLAVVLTDYRSTDLDGDGLDDTWANANFGHSPLTPAERLADADHDGASNYDEFRAGTDPNDPASVFKVSLAYAAGRATLSFPCVEGMNYSVASSADLVTWTPVSDPTFAYPAPGRCEWTDDGKDTGGLGANARFYRAIVE